MTQISQQTAEPVERDGVPAWARERAEMLQGLYIHGLVFVLINGGLFVLNLVSREPGESWWVQWPLMIWGIALLIHVAVAVVPVFSTDWVERRAESIARRHG